MGVKPNKPKVTNYHQRPTTQEAHKGSFPTNTEAISVTVKGTKYDKVYSYTTTATRCSHRKTSAKSVHT